MENPTNQSPATGAPGQNPATAQAPAADNDCTIEAAMYQSPRQAQASPEELDDPNERFLSSYIARPSFYSEE